MVNQFFLYPVYHSKLFQMLGVIYSCICLIGCTTSKVIQYAEETAESETLYWNVEAIKFAAIRDNRYVRMCLELSGTTGQAKKELSVDLEQITQQLENQEAVINEFADGQNTESSLCSSELEEGETALPVSVVSSDLPDITEALQALYQEPQDGPVVSLLKHQTGNYVVFGAPAGMYSGLGEHALGSYQEIDLHYSPWIILLLPLALAVDAVIISVMIILIIPCVIPFLFPLCIPIVIATGNGAIFDPDLYEVDDTSTEEEDLFE